MITYDFPLNERIRTLLRLDDLFAKALYFAAAAGAREHDVALDTLFRILDAGGRADLKVDLLQELERQRQSLSGLRSNPAVSGPALSGALEEVEAAAAALRAITGKVGQHLRDNEWLMTIRARNALPGGLGEFDLPSYHYWRHGDPETRKGQLAGWFAPMLPVRDAVGIVLRLLRGGVTPERYEAVRGVFQLMLAGRTAQMIRIGVPRDLPLIPEVSANKYMLSVRFTTPDADLRPRPALQDFSFDLSFCSL
ncbi:MAG: cell division protein ZapD [Betaproteobacteria bacterium]|nr:cell division protein ZapD [Betaproteobacteria bacterium]